MSSKRVGIVLLSLVVLVSLGILVSAQISIANTVGNVLDEIASVLNAILSPILGSSGDSGEVLFIKVMLFVVVFTVAWLALEAFPLFAENTWAVAIVSIAASILATRFLATAGWIETILLPYSALGIAVSALMPLIIFFFAVERGFKRYPTMRKVCWIFAAVVFTALFFVRLDDIGSAAGTEGFNPAYIYLISAILCAILLLLDKTIQRAFRSAQLDNLVQSRQARARINLLEEVDKVYEMMIKGSLKRDSDDYRTRYNDLKDQADALGDESLVTKILPKPSR